METKPKIYIAGKISKNDWREDLINQDMGRWDYWGIWDKDNSKRYIAKENFIYTGPFFISCDHGCSHGKSTHGAGDNACIEDTPSKKDVFNGCIKQISDANYIFCWIGSLDCYGTLFELGVAYNLGKKIFIGIDHNLMQVCEDCNTTIHPEDDSCYGCHRPKIISDDLWFIKNSGYSNYYPNVELAWKDFMDKNICKVTEEEKEKFIFTLNKEELEDFKELEKKQPLSKIILYFKRNKKIVEQLKQLYDNKCQICQFTFKKDNGENYSETHHVIPLGQRGSDNIKNMVVLCPNCHRQLHYAKNNKYDIKYKEEHYKLLGDNI